MQAYGTVVVVRMSTVSYVVGTGVLFLEVKWPKRKADHLDLVPKLLMNGYVVVLPTPFLPWTFMSCAGTVLPTGNKDLFCSCRLPHAKMC